MTEAIETRELITVQCLDVALRATYHKVCREDSDAQTEPNNCARTGVLFLGSLSPTRAATGDSAVYWADSFAACGYPSFRLDLPGFGDSEGDPPPGLLEFIDTGEFASIISASAKIIVERFELSGIILVGLCAGAVSAIFGAKATHECKGLVLMDPYFHLPLKRRSKTWEKLTGRFSRSSMGLSIESLYCRLKAYWLLLAGNVLPSNANLPLLNCWKDVTSTGLPVILFKAHGFRQRGDFDYIHHVLKLSGKRSKILVKVVEEAGHTFSNRKGRRAVREHVESWLNATFPQSRLGESAGCLSTSNCHDNSSEYSKRELCLENGFVLKGR